MCDGQNVLRINIGPQKRSPKTETPLGEKVAWAPCQCVEPTFVGTASLSKPPMGLIFFWAPDPSGEWGLRSPSLSSLPVKGKWNQMGFQGAGDLPISRSPPPLSIQNLQSAGQFSSDSMLLRFSSFLWHPKIQPKWHRKQTWYMRRAGPGPKLVSLVNHKSPGVPCPQKGA